MSTRYRPFPIALPAPWRAAEAVCNLCYAHAVCLIAETDLATSCYCMWCLAAQLELLTGYRVMNVLAQFQANRKAGADATGKQLRMEVGTDGY